MKKIARRQQQQQQQQQEQEQIGGSRRGPSRGGRLSNDDSEGETSRHVKSRYCMLHISKKKMCAGWANQETLHKDIEFNKEHYIITGSAHMTSSFF